jgi:hypothetical protein
MVEFIPFNLKVHKEIFIQLNVEHLTWVINYLKAYYHLDVLSNNGQNIPEYVEEHLEDFAGLKPPNGYRFTM